MLNEWVDRPRGDVMSRRNVNELATSIFHHCMGQEIDKSGHAHQQTGHAHIHDQPTMHRFTVTILANPIVNILVTELRLRGRVAL